MKITVLIENTGEVPLETEHGLSLFIEYAGRNYLLDAGQSGAFMRNAERLGLDTECADFAVLSHGHYDHADGFLSWLRRYPEKRIFARPDVFDDFYSGSGERMHYIGLAEELKKMSGRFIPAGATVCLDDRVFLIADDVSGDFGPAAKKLFRKAGTQYVQDNFSHEQSLVFDTEEGLVICSSCSHAGIMAITENIRKRMQRPVYAYIGGLHMKSMHHGMEGTDFSPEEIRRMASYCIGTIRYVYTGHCTGSAAVRQLREYMGERLRTVSTGSVIHLPEGTREWKM